MFPHGEHALAMSTASIFAPSSKNLHRELPVNFKPTPYSVLCGRGKECFESVGNRRFRVIVQIYLQQYSCARTKLDKSAIVLKILDTIKSAGGMFVKNIDGRWFEMSNDIAREKVGAMIRDFLYPKYKSAAKSKLARKRNSSRQIIRPQGYRDTIEGDDEEDDHDSICVPQLLD